MNRKGLSLTELMVGMAVSLVVMLLISQTFIAQSTNYSSEEDNIQMQQNIRGASLTLTKELSMAGYRPEADADLPTLDVPDTAFEDGDSEKVEEAGSASIAFQADVDNDGVTETVRYSWGGGAGDPLQREAWEWDGAAWVKSDDSDQLRDLAENITDFSLEYHGVVATYGENAELTDIPLGASDRALVRRIGIELEGRTSQQHPILTRLDGTLVAGLVHWLPLAGPSPACAQEVTSPYETDDGYRKMRIKTGITPRNLGGAPAADDTWGDVPDPGDAYGSSSSAVTI